MLFSTEESNFTYKITITGDSKGERVLEYASWKTSATVNLEPGNYYTIIVEAMSTNNNKILAFGEVNFKSSKFIFLSKLQIRGAPVPRLCYRFPGFGIG